MTVQDYVDSVPEERKPTFLTIREIIRQNIPKGFSEEINYGMIGYVVPHSLYPAGYHCNPKDPLPFMGLASQKKSINLYHLGIYQNEEQMSWFLDEWAKVSNHKIDYGKSCFRFKYFDEIPFEAIKELVGKYTIKEWINIYEESRKSNRKKR